MLRRWGKEFPSEQERKDTVLLHQNDEKNTTSYKIMPYTRLKELAYERRREKTLWLQDKSDDKLEIIVGLN